jgi:2-methylcitrate dehydratase PrpD
MWRITRAAIKPYASCRDTHAAVDAVGRVLDRQNVKADDIAAIHIRANSFLAGMVGGRKVDTLPAAQMSLPYAVAARVLFGGAGLPAYAEERRNDPTVLAMLGKVIIDIDETVTASDQSSVRVILANGAAIEEQTRIALGAPENPLGDTDLIAKFEELASLVLPASGVRSLADATLELDRLADARVVTALLRPHDAIHQHAEAAS